MGLPKSSGSVYNIHMPLINTENPLANRMATTDAIASALRTAIVAGTLLSGESLPQEELASFFGVSRIPVREALRLLESEGWIKFLPNKGASVHPLSVGEAAEIYEILASLECTALRLALPKHTSESLFRSEQILNAARGDVTGTQITVSNLQFHLSLYEPAGRKRLLELIKTFRSRGERYLRLKLSVVDHRKDSDREHREILMLCQKGSSRAVSVLQRHLESTGEMLVRYLESEIHRRKAAASDAFIELQQETLVRMVP